MKSTKLTQFLKHKTITPRRIKNLANKALKNGISCQPAAGKIFLENLKSNDLFEIFKGYKGIYLENNDTSSKVIIIKADNFIEEDKQSYLGYKNISNKTEVKIIRKLNEEK